jgi:hypothetical protein
VAIKSINVFDKGKRHQLINDLRSLSNHTCPFLVQFYGAIFHEGFVKVLLEMMDLGSLDSLIGLAKKNPEWMDLTPVWLETNRNEADLNQTRSELGEETVKHYFHPEQKPLIPEAVAAKIM